MIYLNKFFMISFVLLMSSCTGALAEKTKAVLDPENIASGTVRIFGPVSASKVGLVESEEKTRFLCIDSFAKMISRLVNLTLTVKGEYKKDEKCLSGREFIVVKMPSGREAIVGSVRSIKKEFMIEGVKQGNEGVEKIEYKFRKLPSGLKKYRKEKVIVDAIPVSGDAGYYKVVSYMKHP